MIKRWMILLMTAVLLTVSGLRKPFSGNRDRCGFRNMQTGRKSLFSEIRPSMRENGGTGYKSA